MYFKLVRPNESTDSTIIWCLDIIFIFSVFVSNKMYEAGKYDNPLWIWLVHKCHFQLPIQEQNLTLVYYDNILIISVDHYPIFLNWKFPVNWKFLKEPFIWNKLQGFTKWWLVSKNKTSISKVLLDIPFWVQFHQKWSVLSRFPVKPNLTNKLPQIFVAQKLNKISFSVRIKEVGIE